MKKVFIIKKIIILLVILIAIGLGAFFGYKFMLSAPNGNGEEVTFYVEEGGTYATIGSSLQEKGLIRNALAYKIYIKTHEVGNLEYGKYIIENNLSVEEVIKVLEKGSQSMADTVTVTFVEGKNMRYIISQITKNFNITEKEILDKLKDNDYLDTLINDYWFLSNDIKNKNIYYSLEVYLYPDTYEFYTNASIDDIFRKMLNNMDTKLSKYKDEITKSKYSLHQMLTLASIIELEAGNAKDRKGVAGVFYNRLNDGWSLGSDVTTYYQENIDNYRRDLTR